MRNKVGTCIRQTTDSQIVFKENNRKIIFLNPQNLPYERVDVDGCTINYGVRCDKLLLSADEHEERYVELKGTDVMHAIDQLEETIKRLGEYTDNRHAYVVSTNVAPAINTKRQAKIKYFKERYCAELKIQEKQLTVSLY